MFGITRRQKLGTATATALGLAVVVSSALSQWRVTLAATGVLLTAIFIVLWDLRRRAGDLRRELVRRSVAIEDDGPIEGRRRIESAIREQAQRQNDFSRNLTMLVREQNREIEALFQLYGKIEPRGPMLPSGPWAPTAADIVGLCDMVERLRPALVVELGAGRSTAWLGHSVERGGGGQLVSFDHLEEHVERTRATVKLQQLENTEVRLAPLAAIELDSETFHWYDPAIFSDLHDVGILFVDGPPGGTRPEAKYPAIPLLIDYLANDAFIVLNEVDPTDKHKILNKWIEQTPGLWREKTVAVDYEVLRYRRGQSDHT